MQDILGSVRRSLVFRPTAAGAEGGGEDHGFAAGGVVEKINTCVRKSGLFSKPSPPRQPQPPNKDNATPIRWRKGELIGCGAFGQVYMGMNLDSGELLAIKQVLIATNSSSRQEAQVHIKELEEEVKLLKNLKHPNIVRYLGTAREDETLNILLEFVPGGSISSLLGKFGSFPEAVVRMYTKQLLLGLDYLHKNGIMHRDIKGANILVDNRGCIKLADFGASKQVAELATVSGAKSMKGTPHWMAPEVICQTGHSFSADIWSVGCTVIEMASGKPPWSQQYKEVAALFYIVGTTKAHPPLPDHLSAEAKDFLLNCLKKEPELRPSACELLQHPFVTGEYLQSTRKSFGTPHSACADNLKNTAASMQMCNLGTPGAVELTESIHLDGANDSDDDMCQIGDQDESMIGGMVNSQSDIFVGDQIQSFNPIREPSYDWISKLEDSPKLEEAHTSLDQDKDDDQLTVRSASAAKCHEDLSLSFGPPFSEDDDEVIESKIRAFLEEKALELRKLQTPLFEEFYNSLNVSCSPNFAEIRADEDARKYLKLRPISRSPSRGPPGSPCTEIDFTNSASPGSTGRHITNVSGGSNKEYPVNSSPQSNEKDLPVGAQQEPTSPSVSFSEIQRKWKEELDQELERKREMLRQAGLGGKTSSPKDRALNRQRERSRFASPDK